MAKLGRNEPCHCLSGKKYKNCCLDKDAAQTSARLAKDAEHNRTVFDLSHPLADAWEDDGLAEASNAVVDLANAGNLDEAEAAAHALLVDFPDVVDGLERLGMVHEKRGNNKTSADYYRKALAFIDKFPDAFEEASKDYYKDKIAKLDPQAA